MLRWTIRQNRNDPIGDQSPARLSRENPNTSCLRHVEHPSVVAPLFHTRASSAQKSPLQGKNKKKLQGA
jgi:hypothetical protein